MPRSVWKGPFCDASLLRAVQKVKSSNKQQRSLIKTRSRRSLVVPEFVGCSFHVYNGKRFIPVLVDESMVGYKLGAFAPTRSFRGHTPYQKVKK